MGTEEDKILPDDEDERNSSLGSQNEGSPTSLLAGSFSDGEDSGEVEVEVLSEKGEGRDNCFTILNGLDMEVSVLDELGFKVEERPPTPLLLGSSCESGAPSIMLPVVLVESTNRVQSPITCESLARIDPVGFSEFTAQYSGDVLALEEAMSVWVEQTYKSFGKLVGMPLEEFESECIASLCRIDEERRKIRLESRPHCPPNSTRKGTRELHNLHCQL